MDMDLYFICIKENKYHTINTLFINNNKHIYIYMCLCTYIAYEMLIHGQMIFGRIYSQMVTVVAPGKEN